MRRRRTRRTECSDYQSILGSPESNSHSYFPQSGLRVPLGTSWGHLPDKGHSSPILQHGRLQCGQFNELSWDSESWAKQDHGKAIFFTHKEDWEKTAREVRKQTWCHGERKQVFQEGSILWRLWSLALGVMETPFETLCFSSWAVWPWVVLSVSLIVRWTNNHSYIVRLPDRLHELWAVKCLAQCPHILDGQVVSGVRCGRGSGKGRIGACPPESRTREGPENLRTVMCRKR